MGSFKKCGTCLKIFCCNGKSEINSDQNCGYHLCNGNHYRNSAMEVLMTFSIQHLPFICKNNIFGCEEILDESKLLEHEKYCNYQKVNCAFLEGCKTEVGLLNYLEHFKEAHFVINTDGNGKIFKLPIDLFTMAQKSFFEIYVNCRLLKVSAYVILYSVHSMVYIIRPGHLRLSRLET